MKKFINSKKIWFAFITVFISGVVIGVVAGSGASIYMGMKMHKPGFMRSRLLGHMARELELNDEQKLKAEKIMTEMSEQLREIRKEQYPKIRIILSTAFSDIEKILDEEQKVRFKEIRERVKNFHHSRHGNKTRNDHYKEKIDNPSFLHDDDKPILLEEEIQYPFKSENEEAQLLLETLLYLHGY